MPGSDAARTGGAGTRSSVSLIARCTCASAGISAAWPPPSPLMSTEMIGVPTSAVWPSGTSSRATVPSYGLGSSTTAFAVSISTMI